MQATIFHLAFPVHDVAEAKRFYVDGMGCVLGRESATALVLGLAGHQLVAHLDKEPTTQKGIYPRHFGLIFSDLAGWEALRDRAQQQGLTFFQQPHIRFEGTPLEHRTFFLEDPSRNLLEFKYYSQDSAIFGERDQDRIGDAS